MSREDLMQKGFKVSGRVQGVYFRVWTVGIANELGLRGTVRNRRDGSVEAHVCGPLAAVSEFERQLWVGPSAALVSCVEVVDSQAELPHGPFQILPTV